MSYVAHMGGVSMCINVIVLCYESSTKRYVHADNILACLSVCERSTCRGCKFFLERGHIAKVSTYLEVCMRQLPTGTRRTFCCQVECRDRSGSDVPGYDCKHWNAKRTGSCTEYLFC